MPVNRRRQRSVRITVAVSLLAAATATVLGGLLAGGALWLGTAAVVAWAAGVAASRILSNELAASRREHAQDRAEQAQAYTDLAEQRATEQARFSATMKQKIEDHAATITRLKATLRLAEKRAEFAEQTANRNQVAVAKAHKEIAELKARIGELGAALRDEQERARESDDSVCDLESLGSVADASTVVDLLKWEDKVTDRGGSEVEHRKQA
jgi:chromosome segregation ATPase